MKIFPLPVREDGQSAPVSPTATTGASFFRSSEKAVALKIT
jgi:hypothetical protein